MQATPLLTYLSLIITTFFWGATFIAGRLLGETVLPVNSAFFRFTVATLSLAVLVQIIEGRITIPPRSMWPSILLLGLTGVFSYNLCFFYGLRYIEAGRASLLIALNPLAISLAAVIFFGERLSASQFCGILLSLLGALFVISNGHPSAIFSGGFGIGETAILGCVASWATYSLIGRKVLTMLSPLNAVFYSSLSGTLMLLPFSLSRDAFGAMMSFSGTDWTAIIFLGLLATAVGFTLYYLAIKNIGAARSSVFINLVPVFSILLSWLFLGESIKVSVLTGGVILLSGVYLTNRPKRTT